MQPALHGSYVEGTLAELESGAELEQQAEGVGATIYGFDSAGT